MDLKEIRTLIELMVKNGVTDFEMEREGFKIRMKTADLMSSTPATTSGHFVGSLPQMVGTASPVVPTSAGLPTSPSTEASEPVGIEIKSPMVGTFYGSPSPENPPFVKVGDSVTAETVVCIIEAMKVMNEIRAEVSGIVAEVCVENGRSVQFGQPLFRLK